MFFKIRRKILGIAAQEFYIVKLRFPRLVDGKHENVAVQLHAEQIFVGIEACKLAGKLSLAAADFKAERLLLREDFIKVEQMLFVDCVGKIPRLVLHHNKIIRRGGYALVKIFASVHSHTVSPLMLVAENCVSAFYSVNRGGDNSACIARALAAGINAPDIALQKVVAEYSDGA